MYSAWVPLLTSLFYCYQNILPRLCHSTYFLFDLRSKATDRDHFVQCPFVWIFNGNNCLITVCITLAWNLVGRSVVMRYNTKSRVTVWVKAAAGDNSPDALDKKISIGYIFWMVSDRAMTFCLLPFYSYQNLFTLWLWPGCFSWCETGFRCSFAIRGHLWFTNTLCLFLFHLRKWEEFAFY